MKQEEQTVARTKITVTINPEVIKKVDTLVREQVYRNRSHAVEVALMRLVKKGERP